ncbi:exodeoxyribonuclease V subunit gamma [Pseudomonas sp. 5P_3.1_Bac2]|uniref:exodeoxyribonuclease V subunit gamma n=1 Tax=Pseudomonas sp. 5P_3.1_Bac2 TaxID=2971617 RepID=UPI0021C781C6|nr:exodeoxyribonuclease V subunit gamma [Pseudomonas sp. 5P_3.1_Bac2]MCU1719466.1 exodeoxyribonuclease V subunit gamma [Pseudomonas sp. 5P_3.1_Bac2]
MQQLSPGLMVIHGNRLEALRTLAVTWMREQPLRPLENEVLLVQSNGIAQWLKLALAEDDGCGIAAALDVGLPARFLWQVYRAVLGSEAIPKVSPLDKAPLTWRLMRLLPSLLAEESFAPLRRFLADDHDLRKRYQLAERLADLFDQYQVYRADWLADWSEGRDQLRNARGEARPLDAALTWQPALWRALLVDVGSEHLAQSRAGVHPRFVQRMAELNEAPPGLPRRVSIFGISSLPAQVLEALAAMSRFSQVMLYVQNPCQHHWGDIVEGKDLLRHEYRRQQRKGGAALALSELDLHQQAQPLLAAWGKQGRDYINLLDQYDEPQRYRDHFDRIDLFIGAAQDSLLGQLQNDILELRPPAESRSHWPAVRPDDHSLRFHIAHSAQREVEVLHDQLLASFSADPSLRPRDVIVMVPDVNTYAAHIQAVFGQYASDDPRHIPFTLADQGLRGKEPLLIALEHLLQLPQSRFSVSHVMDLLDVAALRARFAIDESALPTLRHWLEGAGVRWGLNARQRAELGLGSDLEQNTWRFGLRRMLLGYAMGSAGAYAGIEPYDEIGGLDAALIGPLVRLLDALELHWQALAEAAPAEQWGERLRQLLADFFLSQNEHDELLLNQLHEGLEGWLELCAEAQLAEAISLPVVREAWLAGLDQGRISQRFLAGAVNFCTLMPMRAIPFRHVCLLGMNDGDYPRSPVPLDFDLMAGDYRPGDRSRREDDRYLLLEALLAARDHLYISWIGRSIRDNSERPASVLVGQLRDHLASAWTLAGGGDLLHALTLEHPLQPFSLRYFSQQPGLFSYAHEWAALHQQASPVTADEPLPYWPGTQELSPELLQSFLRDPLKCFFTRRLKVFLDEQEQADLDIEPFALDGLQRYQLQERLLNDALPHADRDSALLASAERMQRQGVLPLAGFGQQYRSALLAPLPKQLQRYAMLCELWPQRLDSPRQLSLQWGEGASAIRLEGWLSHLRERGDGALAQVQVVPGALAKGKALKWHRLLRPFVLHVLAAACGVPIHTLLVGEDQALHFVPLEQDAAAAIAHGWLQAWQAGMQAPLPVALKTSLCWLQEDSHDKAQAIYEGGYQVNGEVQSSASLARQFPDYAALSQGEGFTYWSEQLYRALLVSNPAVVDDLEVQA